MFVIKFEIEKKLDYCKYTKEWVLKAFYYWKDDIIFLFKLIFEKKNYENNQIILIKF